jgi:flavin reductase (DIM6/NTAB) family NADH-FMN oxidoreductase RutF
MLTINPKEVSVAVLHAYLQSSIAPRPIAFASTIDKDGNVNLSPFSFFNVFGTNPPTLIFSPNRRVRDGSQKHTLENVLEHDEVVINMVDFSMVEQMSLASCEYKKGINEFVKGGFTEETSMMVKPPRVKESKAAFECKVKQVIQMSEEGGSPNLVICEVVLVHFSEDILDENGKIDQTKTDWVARLGGDWYVRASGDALFEVAKPSIHKGIGVEAIPDFIKNDSSFSGNDLGRLGNIEELPTEEEINTFIIQNPNANYKEKAKKFMINGQIKEAWLALLSQSRF